MQHRFVEYIPEEILEGILYVSMQYGTVVHKCCCGCGQEVVTPITPTDWKLLYDGESITLSPSIGNWSFKCRSHYFIKKSEIVWCGSWNKKQVVEEKLRDSLNKEQYFEKQTKDSILNVMWTKLKHFLWGD